jgi:hypothetical protein
MPDYNSAGERVKKIILCTTAALAFVSCTHYDIDELLDAPEQVDIEGYSFFMDAYLRDYIPIANNTFATVIISTVDSSDFPLWLDADEIWVINGEKVWHDCLIDNDVQPVAWLITRHSDHTGPNWTSGIYVDVVVQLIDDSDNIYLIRESDVFIYPC